MRANNTPRQKKKWKKKLPNGTPKSPEKLKQKKKSAGHRSGNQFLTRGKAAISLKYMKPFVPSAGKKLMFLSSRTAKGRFIANCTEMPDSRFNTSKNRNNHQGLSLPQGKSLMVLPVFAGVEPAVRHFCAV